jgi:creatinine amidohydrolase
VEILLLEQSHTEARRLLKTGAPVYLTVNPVEYHGPHLSLHNDRLISRGLIRVMHAALTARGFDWPLLIANDLELGVEPCPGPGTRHTRFQRVRESVLESCRALVELGASKVVLMTFHGAPLHGIALQAGVNWLREHRVGALAPFHVVLRELLMYENPAEYSDTLDPIADPQDRKIMETELKYDFHAGFFETSMALHLAPSSVAPLYKTLPPCPRVTPDPKLLHASRAARALKQDMLARELELAAVGFGWTNLRPFPGYTSRPHLASAATGAAFTRRMAERYAPMADAVLRFREEPPRPIMPWLEKVSVGGRFGGAALPRANEFTFA